MGDNSKLCNLRNICCRCHCSCLAGTVLCKLLRKGALRATNRAATNRAAINRAAINRAAINRAATNRAATKQPFYRIMMRTLAWRKRHRMSSNSFVKSFFLSLYVAGSVKLHLQLYSTCCSTQRSALLCMWLLSGSNCWWLRIGI